VRHQLRTENPSNPTFSYPIILLPRELKELGGQTANVYQTEICGVVGFFNALQLDNLDKFVEDTVEQDQRLFQAQIKQSTLKTKGRGRDSNPRRGLHSFEYKPQNGLIL
jgi:hypothetical protein